MILPDEESHLRVVEPDREEDLNAAKEELLRNAYLQVVRKMIEEALRGNYNVAKLLYPDMSMQPVKVEDNWSENGDEAGEWDCEVCRFSDKTCKNEPSD